MPTTAEFRKALATDSADVESRIGLAAGLGNRAELHMLLGRFSLNLDPPHRASARSHAEEALRLQPQWRYVRERLLPKPR